MVASFFDQLGQPGGDYASARNVLLDTYRKLQAEQQPQMLAPMPMVQAPQVLRSPVTLPPGLGGVPNPLSGAAPNPMMAVGAQNPFSGGFQPGGSGGPGPSGGEPFGMDGPAGRGGLGAMIGMLSPVGTTARALAGALGINLGPFGIDMSLAPTPYSGGFQSATAAEGQAMRDAALRDALDAMIGYGLEGWGGGMPGGMGLGGTAPNPSDAYSGGWIG